jgi:hypothetical protein
MQQKLHFSSKKNNFQYRGSDDGNLPFFFRAAASISPKEGGLEPEAVLGPD